MSATPNLRSDLSDYFGILWNGRWAILIGTALAMLIMSAFTWAMTPFYGVTSEIDAGSLALARPKDLNLLVEAVDRNQFPVEGGRFPETTPKALTVTFRPPWTMKLIAVTTNQADALRRLDVLTHAVKAELDMRFSTYVANRTTIESRPKFLQADLETRRQALLIQLRDRMATDADTIARSKTDAARAAGRLSSLQTTARAAYREQCIVLRDRLMLASDREAVSSLDEIMAAFGGEGQAQPPATLEGVMALNRRRLDAIERLRKTGAPFLPELSRRFSDMNVAEGQFARAAALRRAAERRYQVDGRAIAAVETLAVFDQRSLESAKTALTQEHGEYMKDSDPLATSVKELIGIATVLSAALNAADVSRAEPVMKAPAITLLATPLPGRLWPRPLVNLTVAFLFGLVASVLFVVFKSRALDIIRTDLPMRSQA